MLRTDGPKIRQKYIPEAKQIECLSLGSVLTLLSMVSTLLVLITLPAPAYAHPDFLIADQTFSIDPRKFLGFPLSVHYHRVVGSFQVISPAGGLVNVYLMDDQTFARYVAGQPAPELYSSGKTNSGVLDFLIPCCIGGKWNSGTYESGQRNDYTKYHLVIDNRESSSSTTVRLRVDLLHDGIAVITYYGEPFAVAQVGGLFISIPAIWSFTMMKRARNISSAGNIRMGRKLVLSSVGSVATLFIIAISIYGFSAAIKRAYGESVVASLSFPLGLVGEVLSIAAIITPWVFAVYIRKGSLHIAERLGSGLLGAIFLMLGVGSLLLGLLTFGYGFTLPQIFFHVIFGTLQVLGGMYLISKFRRKVLMR